MKKTLAYIVILMVFFLVGCKKNTESLLGDKISADSVRINEIQVIGSHNSYRLKTYDKIFDFAQSLSPILPPDLNPDGWDYSHLPLDEQFSDYGIRKIELDIYYDPDGGRFANRMGNQLVGEPVESGEPELDAPGFKVIHIADLDYRTNYLTLKSALTAVKDWSDAHPRHLPIFILIEAKETAVGDLIPGSNYTEALPFDAAAMNDIDKEIREIFSDDLSRILTPDDVRGEYMTLNQAITTEGWPRIGDVRGKIVFLLDNGGSTRDIYVQGHPSLSGRILFTDSPVGSAESAFIKLNNPNNGDISQLVAEGYLVRTRADSDTEEARSGDISNREAAFNSGAQLISTDYYRPDPRHNTSAEWTDYCVKFPGNAVARLNPVNGPENFSGEPFE